MPKRNMFEELMEGFDALEEERQGKRTLKTTRVEMPAPVAMSGKDIALIRKRHKCSQQVFSRILATNVGTLRNWEQGRAEPNQQAKLLLKMVEIDPEMLDRLHGITRHQVEGTPLGSYGSVAHGGLKAAPPKKIKPKAKKSTKEKTAVKPKTKPKTNAIKRKKAPPVRPRKRA